MIAIPAVDLRDGACVQLEGGSYAHERVRLDDPLAAARTWVEEGARFLHVVDLDGARVVDSIATGARPLILDVVPGRGEVWVPNQAANTLSVIDIASRSVVATIANLKTQPHAVGFSADGKTAFISCENQVGGADVHHPLEGSKVPGIVYVVDVATRQITRTVEVGAFAAGIAVGR